MQSAATGAGPPLAETLTHARETIGVQIAA